MQIAPRGVAQLFPEGWGRCFWNFGAADERRSDCPAHQRKKPPTEGFCYSGGGIQRNANAIAASNPTVTTEAIAPAAMWLFMIPVPRCGAVRRE